MGGRVRLTATDTLLCLNVPDVHFAIEISKASQTNQPTQIAPNDIVLVLFAELEQYFIVLGKEDGLSWHEPTYHNKMFTSQIPVEVMHWSLSRFDLDDLVRDIVEKVQSILAVIRLTSRIVVSLKLNQELVGVWTESDFDLLGLVDGLLVVGFIILLVEEGQLALVGFVV